MKFFGFGNQSVKKNAEFHVLLDKASKGNLNSEEQEKLLNFGAKDFSTKFKKTLEMLSKE